MPHQLMPLLVHNYYQEPGGEDRSHGAECALLESRGHQVLRYSVHNDAVEGMNKLRLARRTIWNDEVYHELRALIRRRRPHVVHFNNTFPLISPAAYYAARAEGVPVVQTLRNYRLFCLNSYFHREGRVCEDCLGRRVPWPGVVHACYRGDRMASGVVAALLGVHRALGTWEQMVDVYVVLTEFARRKFVEAGLPAEKLVRKPNFLSGTPEAGPGEGGYALFVGRLSREKGINTLLSAWKRIGNRLPLKVVGDGPLAPAVSEAAQGDGVEWLGRRTPDEVQALMANAMLLVFPSELYETFGRVAMEAFAAGTPVVASDIGAIAELVEHGKTGRLFKPGDAEHLAAQVVWALEHPAETARMRRRARATFEANYTPERNYRMLMEVYASARRRAQVRDTNGVMQRGRN